MSSVAALVGRNVAVVARLSHVGAMIGGNAANADTTILSHQFTPVTGHRYLLIASGGVTLDVSDVTRQMRHLLIVGTDTLASARLSIARGPWSGGAGGLSVRLMGTWVAPSDAPVTARWSCVQDWAMSDWILSNGKQTLTVLDLGVTG